MQGEATAPRNTPTAEPFVVMAKPVGPLCNLACGYCYYSEHGRSHEVMHQFRMPDSLLETFIRQYIMSSPGPVVSFTWHGGEPTLAGLDFYRRAVEIQKTYLPQGVSCWNSLQTNGMLLDDAWCSFLADERFDVGLSIDGAQWVHDENRRDHSGKGTYERAVAAVRLLQSHGIQPDLLCTVTSRSAKDPLAVYRALRDLNTGWIQFIPIVRRIDGRTTADTVSGDKYGYFLCAIFDEWIRHDLNRLGVQIFAETALVAAGGQASLCWMAPTCGRVLVVEHDGGAYSCDHFVTPAHRLGEIMDVPLRTLVDMPEQRRFGNNKQNGLPSQCHDCAWIAYCNGGCPKDRFDTAKNGEPGLNFLCAGLLRFFAHADQPLRKIIRLRGQGLTTEAIMAKMNAEYQARPRVGRNAPCPCGSGRKAKHCCGAK